MAGCVLLKQCHPNDVGCTHFAQVVYDGVWGGGAATQQIKTKLQILCCRNRMKFCNLPYKGSDF